MQGAFATVVFVVAGVGVAGAILALLLNRRTWNEYAANHMLRDSEGTSPARAAVRAPGADGRAADADAERDEEIRQMMEARNARRRRRGEPELDVAQYLAPPTPHSAPAIDAELREEIRQLVIARNHRRRRRGEPELDVETEIEREIASLGQL